MTVKELKKKCEGMIADGFGDSEIVLCTTEDGGDEEDYCELERGFSSVAYNPNSCEVFLEENGYDIDNVVILN